LKSLPLPEVEKKLGSSPDGLSQAGAQKRLAQYGPNEIEVYHTPRTMLVQPKNNIRRPVLGAPATPTRSRQDCQMSARNSTGFGVVERAAAETLMNSDELR
jgi:hypothetical protein